MPSFFNTILNAIGLGDTSTPEPTPQPIINVEVTDTELQERHTQLMRMYTLMIEDGDDNFSRGVKLTADYIQSALSTPEERVQFFNLALNTFLGMMAGMGGLSDFYIANASPEELEARRNEYDALSKSLSKYFWSFK